MDKLMDEAIREAILYTLAYADVFDYPLTAEEIHRYLVGVTAPIQIVDSLINEENLLTRTGEYYTLPGRDRIVDLRKQRGQRSERLWPHAIRFGRLIAALPYVRMIAVTGSLAVNNVGEDADVDYLVVTAPGRLWTVRAAALVVAQFAALWRVKLCPNYLISEQTLVFPDQTLYAAHELAQMIPLAGFGLYGDILQRNSWMKKFLPNALGLPPAALRLKHPSKPGRFQSTAEKMLPRPLSDRIERWEMERKIERLILEQRSSQESAFSADICKGHDRQHARRTEVLLQERLVRLSLEVPQ